MVSHSGLITVMTRAVRKAAPNGGPLQIANRLRGRSRRLRAFYTLVGKPTILRRGVG